MKKTFWLLLLLLPFIGTACQDDDEPVSPEEIILQQEWVLQSIDLPQPDGSTVRVPGQNIRLRLTNASTFQQDNEPGVFDLTGTMPVNQYFGRYAVTGAPIVPSTNGAQSNVIQVKQVGSTEVGGPPEKLQLEQLYLAALREAVLANWGQDEKLVLVSRHQSAQLVFCAAKICAS